MKEKERERRGAIRKNKENKTKNKEMRKSVKLKKIKTKER